MSEQDKIAVSAAYGAVPSGWEKAIEDIRNGINNDEPSGFDRSGYREYACAVLDTVNDELHALSTHSQHSDDAAVDRFAAAMKEKLARTRSGGRGGWEQCSATDLSVMLRAHVDKGDPIDVANFCTFLWNNGQGITANPSAAIRNAALEAAACPIDIDYLIAIGKGGEHGVMQLLKTEEDHAVWERNVRWLIDAITGTLQSSPAPKQDEVVRGKFFLFDQEKYFHPQIFETEDERDKAAKDAIDEHLSPDLGWSEEVENIVCGVITHECVKTNVRQKPQDDDPAYEDWNHAFDEICSYEMRPVAQSPDAGKESQA